MRTCSNCDIAFNERFCPLCEAMSQIRKLETKIDNLELNQEQKELK